MISYFNKLLSLVILLWMLSMMMGRTLLLAQGLDSHVHGHAELNLVMAGQQMQIEFISPAMNLLGFERAPGSSEETDLLVQTTIDLQTSDWLLGDALGNCQLSKLVFEGPVFEQRAHEHAHEDEHEHDEDKLQTAEGSHAEFHVQYLYDCPATPAREYRVAAFERFSGIEEITVQWIAGGRQGLAELTPSESLLILE